MKEDFVPFDLAVKLKEKGFDKKTRCGYLPPMLSLLEAFNDTDWSAKNGYAAPVISQVLKWLREEKSLHIEIRLFTMAYGFDIIHRITKEKLGWSGTVEYSHYEDVAIAGIEYALDNIL